MTRTQAPRPKPSPASPPTTPPHSAEAEAASLGSFLIDPDAWEDEAGLLSPLHFYVQRHRVIFGAMQRVVKQGLKIDVKLLFEELRRTDEVEAAGGLGYLAELSNHVATAANVGHYARLVRRYATQRATIEAAHALDQEARRTDDPSALLARTSEALEQLAATESPQLVEGRDVLARVVSRLERQEEEGEDTFHVSTGYPCLDKLLAGGFAKGELVLVGGNSGMGKTSLCVEFFRRMVAKGAKGLYFSTELRADEFAMRLTAQETRIDLEALMGGKQDQRAWDRMIGAMGRMRRWTWAVDDSEEATIPLIAHHARHRAKTSGLDLLVVDHIHRLEPIAEQARLPRRDQLDGIVRVLQRLARSLGVVVIAAAQLNDDSRAKAEANTKGGRDPRPTQSNFLDCRTLGKEAGVVLFPFRPSYFDPNASPDLGEVIIDKARHRRIQRTKVMMRCDSTAQTWDPLSDRED